MKLLLHLDWSTAAPARKEGACGDNWGRVDTFCMWLPTEAHLAPTSSPDVEVDVEVVVDHTLLPRVHLLCSSRPWNSFPPLSCWAKAKGMGWQGIVRWMRMHFLSYLGAWKHPWTEWCDETQLVSSSPLAGWCQREQGQKCLDGFLFDLWLHNGQTHNLPCHQSD